MRRKTRKLLAKIVASLMLVGGSATASAIAVNWTDWESSSNTSGYTALGTILSGTESIGVTYNNPQGIAFDQLNGSGIDFWQNGRAGRDPATSPYTSPELTNGADNIPDGTDIIALTFAGSQTLSFSQTIANPFFSYVSLNGNGYAFDQDFDLLSVGGVDGNDCGYWGCGTSFKQIVDLGSGVFEYQLLGTGEPHGTLRFTGAFDNVTWRSLSSENWNGFTVGVEGTQDQIFPCDVDPTLPECNPGTGVPAPGTLLLMVLGLAGLRYSTRKQGLQS